MIRCIGQMEKYIELLKVKNKLVKGGYIYIHLQMRNMKYNSEIINQQNY